MQSYESARKDFAQRIAEARGDAAGHQDILALIDSVEAAANAFHHEIGGSISRLTRDNRASGQAAQSPRTAGSGEVMAAFRGAEESMAAFRVAADGVRGKIGAWSAEGQNNQDQMMRFAYVALAAGGITAVLVALLVGWRLSRDVAGPVTEMAEAMRKLAAGDVAIVVPGAGRKDELGQMRRRSKPSRMRPSKKRRSKPTRPKR